MADVNNSLLFDQVATTAITDRIFEKLKSVLGASDLLFTMEFPGRLLDFHSYEYHSKDRHSVLTKPYPVAEAEFRLSENLFNPAPITQGPNGHKLSVVYNTVINNYVPRLKDVREFFVDRFRLKEWLLTEIEEEFEGNKVRCSRMAFSQKLYDKYLREKNTWNKDKRENFDARRGSLVTDPDGRQVPDYEGYSRWVTSEGLVRDEALNSLFSDAVVRGHYHEVLTFLGFLNVASVPEQLEITKQNMRASVRQSLDASMQVYPVQYQPADWYNFLRPNLTPRDLLSSTEVLMDAFMAKQARRDVLKSRLADLKSQHIDQSVLEELEKSTAQGKVELDRAESALKATYGDGVVAAFKIYLNAQTGGLFSKGLGLSSVAKPSAVPSSGALAKLLPDNVFEPMLNAYKGHAEVLRKQEQLVQLQARKVHVESHNFRSEMQALERQILGLTREIAFLEPLLSGVLHLKNESSFETIKEIEPAKSFIPSDVAIVDIVTLRKAASDKVTTKATSAVDRTTAAKVLEQLEPSVLRFESLSGADLTAVLTDYPGVSSVAGLKAVIAAVGIDGAATADQKKAAKALQERLQSSTALLPENQDVNDGDGLFTDIVIEVEMTRNSDSSFSVAESSSSQAQISAWFFNASARRQSSSSATGNRSSVSTYKCQIGFRVAKVTFDRGNWFNPTILSLTNSFYRLSNFLGGRGLTIKAIMDAAAQATTARDDTALKNLTTVTVPGQPEPMPCVLPSYPVAFAVAKDITIKFLCTQSDAESMNRAFQQDMSAGGSCLFFSCSTASATQATAATAFSSFSSDGFTIRIPGPQIIAWFQQLVPMDKSTPYQSLREDQTDVLQIQRALDEEMAKYRALTQQKKSVESEVEKDSGDW